MLINCLAIFLVSFLTGILAVILFKKLALKSTFLIGKGIPLVGGISLALAFVCGVLASWFIFRLPLRQIIGILFSSITMLGFGLFDDRRELSITTKFLVQIIAASVLIFSGVRTQIVYIGDLANIAVTLIWVIGITNAFNHLDIMDGLAGGVAVIASAAFLTTAFFNQDIQSLILALALLAAILSFLAYNLPPAKVYMGNSGSHFLGFVLSAVALLINYAPMERKIALFSPLLILGLPIFDTVFLSIARLKKHILPFKKSDDHLVLLLLKSGYSRKQALAGMFLLTLIFSVSGVALTRIPNYEGIILVVVIMLMSVALIVKMGKFRVNR
ncbi:MAG: MraY family glycosyltransferase [Candidatus Omnitrophota bacterium]